MDKKPFLMSNEIWVGIGLIIMGLLAQVAGGHELILQALTPFGIGLILSDVLTRFGKATRETVKVIIRREDD